MKWVQDMLEEEQIELINALNLEVCEGNRIKNLFLVLIMHN